MIYWSLRTEELCPNERDCFDSLEIRDAQGVLIDRQHGPGCRLKMFEQALRSPRGEVMRRVADFDREMEAGIHWSPDDLDAREARALLIVKEEKFKKATQKPIQDHAD